MADATSDATSAPDGTWRKMLEARPVRNSAAEVLREEAETLTIKVKMKRPRPLLPPLSWFVRPRVTRTIRLDRLGTQIWELCDGERTVEDVVDEFARRHRLTFHEARASVTAYLKLLVQRGVLAMVM